MDINKTIKEMKEKGQIYVSDKGEINLTEKGLKEGTELAKDSPEYMRQVAKKFKQNPTDKETVNIKDLKDEIEEVDNTKLSIYERMNIPENDDLKNYQLFCKLTEKNPEIDSDMIFKLMKEAKYFEIPNNLNLLLLNTKNPVRKVRFPHYLCFLDFNIVVYDRIYCSILITDLFSIAEKLKRKDLPEKIDIMGYYHHEEGWGWFKTDLYAQSKNKYMRKIKEYIMNFVDFVNSEDVKFTFREKTEKNIQRRIASGKVPLPSHNKIRVVGYLARYLNQLEEQESRTRFSHRFWVRGHFRRFYDKQKYKKLYHDFKEGKLKRFEGKKYNIDDGYLRVWVYPYIKGDGILVNQKYKLK